MSDDDYDNGFIAGFDSGLASSAIKEIDRLRVENETLREALNDIYKEFIETEGFTMETYLEDDLWHKIKRMARIAAKNKRAAAATIRESGE